jgi:hypothetical protein
VYRIYRRKLPVVIIAIMNSLFGRWRRLNYRAAWATLLTASYMDLIDTSESYEPPRIRARSQDRRFRLFSRRRLALSLSLSLSSLEAAIALYSTESSGFEDDAVEPIASPRSHISIGPFVTSAINSRFLKAPDI